MNLQNKQAVRHNLHAIACAMRDTAAFIKTELMPIESALHIEIAIRQVEKANRQLDFPLQRQSYKETKQIHDPRMKEYRDNLVKSVKELEVKANGILIDLKADLTIDQKIEKLRAYDMLLLKIKAKKDALNRDHFTNGIESVSIPINVKF